MAAISHLSLFLPHHNTMNLPDKLQDLKQWDKQRAGFPGEHWLALGAGMLLMKRAGRSRSFLGRLVGRSLGAALMARAASGRNGPLGKMGLNDLPTRSTSQGVY